jgi:hypothetical protein
MNNLCMDCKSLPERYIDPTGYRPHWYSNPGNEGSGGGSLIYAALQRQMGNHGINYQGGSGSGEGGNASSGSYYYDWDDEVYRDSFTNEKVEFSEVYTNFVQPNSTGYSFDYDYGFEKVISSISFNSDEGEYGIDRLTLKIEYKNALVLKLVLKKPMLPIQDQAGGGDGSLAIDIASGSATGFGLATSLRYKLEWEYLRQARINRAISGDFSKPIKHSLRTIRGFGTGFTVAGGFIGVVNFGLSDRSWGDYGQLGVSLLSTGLAFGSVTAPIGIGIGLIDTFGGFNGFYNYLDNQQNFYNNTGGIMVPINGIPSFIPLK